MTTSLVTHSVPTITMMRDQFRAMLAALPDEPNALYSAITASVDEEAGR